MKQIALRFLLSGWFFGLYCVLGILNFVLLSGEATDLSEKNAFFITLGLMTGGDPYSFKSEIESDVLLWSFAWAIHVASWLLIPALIGLFITDVADQEVNSQLLLQTLERVIGDADPGIGPKEQREIALEVLSEMNKEFRQTKR